MKFAKARAVTSLFAELHHKVEKGDKLLVLEGQTSKPARTRPAKTAIIPGRRTPGSHRWTRLEFAA